MTRAISSHSPELTEILFKAGDRAVVLVEGVNDQYALREWFDDRLSEVEFFECGGIQQVEKLLDEFLAQSSLKRGYAIIDRDFRSDEEVTESRKLESHRFVLRRYSLENYLADVKPICEELRTLRKSGDVNSTEEEARLLELYRTLKTISAIHWVFWENRVNYWPVGYAMNSRELLIHKAAQDLGRVETEVETLIAKKEILLDAKLKNLETAHTVTSGKRLMHWVHREFGFDKLDKEYFHRLLVRAVKLTGIPDDVKEIVLNRILADT